jgi:hypothetical protein
MNDSSPTGRAIFKAVGRSLKLARASSQLLTVSQLLAMEGRLRKMFAVISDEIETKQSGTSFAISKSWATHTCFTDGYQIIIDVSDYEDSSDEEKEGGKGIAGPANGK